MHSRNTIKSYTLQGTPILCMVSSCDTRSGYEINLVQRTCAPLGVCDTLDLWDDAHAGKKGTLCLLCYANFMEYVPLPHLPPPDSIHQQTILNKK